MSATASPFTGPSTVCSMVYDQPQEIDNCGDGHNESNAGMVFATSTTSMFGGSSQDPTIRNITDGAPWDQSTQRNQPTLTLDTFACLPMSTATPEAHTPTRPRLITKVTSIFKRRASPSEAQKLSTEAPRPTCSHSPTTSASDLERPEVSSSSNGSSGSSPVLKQPESPTFYNRSRITIQEPSDESRVSNRPRATTSFRGTIAHLLAPELKLERCHTGDLNTAGAGTKSRQMSIEVPKDCLDVPVSSLSDEFRTWPQNFSILGWSRTKIGKGTTANVHKRHKKSSGKAFAVKEFRPMDPSEIAAHYEQKIKSEAAIAMSVDHPNIVKTSMLCIDHDKWFLVMEHCSGGDLFSLIHQKYLSKDNYAADRFCIFKQIIQAIDYLHSQGIAHRDIKPDNILIDADSHIKITDFGSSEVFCGQHPAMRSSKGICGTDMGEIRLCEVGVCGSVPYLPPEVIDRKNKYDPRLVDVWGVATVMLCMTFGGYFWERAEMSTSEHYDNLVASWAKWYKNHPGQENPRTNLNDYPHVKLFDAEIRPPALRRLLLNMLNPDCTKRYTMAEVASSSYVKGIECCAVYVPLLEPDNPLSRQVSPIYRTHDHFPNPRDKLRRRPTQ